MFIYLLNWGNMKNENKEKHSKRAKLKYHTFQADLFFLKIISKNGWSGKKWNLWIMQTKPPSKGASVEFFCEKER